MLKYRINKSTLRLQGEDTIVYYKVITPVDPVTLEQVVDEISGVCTLTRADIKAGLAAMETAILKHLRNGSSVRLDDFGTFRPTISGKSQPSIEALHAQNHMRLRVRFRPSRWLKESIKPENVRMEAYVAPTLEA